MFIIGNLAVDPSTRRVSYLGRSLTLSGLNLELLIALAREAPESLSREGLTKKVWQRDHVSADTVAKRVSLLRQALQEEGAHDIQIEALPNSQYRILSLSENIQTSAEVPTETRDWASYSKPIWVGLLLLVLASVAVLTWLQKQDRPILVSPDGKHTLEAPR